MRHKSLPPRWHGLAVVAAALALAGCGGAKRARELASLPRPVSIVLYLPCVIGGPMQRVAAAYEAEHPEVTIAPRTYKPLETLAGSEGEPAVVVTVGDREMEALVAAGAVDRREVRTFGVNESPLAVVAPAEGAPELKTVSDLARPSVQHILLEDPLRSSLGERARQGFEKLGLWEKIRPKLVEPTPGVMVLSDLLSGKGEAVVVFKGCLFADAEGGTPPKTVRIVGELPLDPAAPIPYQVAPLRGAHQEEARGFVKLLTGEEGKGALRKAGLKPKQ